MIQIIINNNNNIYTSFSQLIFTSNMIIRISCLVGVSVLAGIVPCFTRICSLIGCLTLSLLSFILPPLFAIRLQWLERNRQMSFLAVAFMVYCLVFIAVGLISIVAGLGLVFNGNCEG